MPPEPRNHSQESHLEFEQALAEAERSLSDLKAHYAQIQVSQTPLSSPERESLRGNLRGIQEKLEELQFYLKFLLFQWSETKEPFWQAVRFGGLGIIIGWLLKSWGG